MHSHTLCLLKLVDGQMFLIGRSARTCSTLCQWCKDVCVVVQRVDVFGSVLFLHTQVS